MFTFKLFFTEQKNITAMPQRLEDFFFHLTSDLPHHPKKILSENIHIDEEMEQSKVSPHIVDMVQKIKEWRDQNPGNLYSKMRQGFYAAFPENETDKERKIKTKESIAHFRNFMAEHAGLSPNNSAKITSENGKTILSKGVGRHTIGIAMAPHDIAGVDSWNSCPKASTECRQNCLGLTAGGNKQYPRAALRAKVSRTHYMLMHPEHFARIVDHELMAHEKETKKKGMESGFRGNVTTDLPYEHLMPKKFFEKHKDTHFYDYTKLASRVGKTNIPNYTLALSHTGTNHPESNDKEAIDILNKGGVVAMVYHRGKNIPKPTHVEDVQSGKRWKVVDGDSDDNVDDRHLTANIPKTEGVVSGLKLKGVTNQQAGKFANPVDSDGVIRINKVKYGTAKK